MSSVSAKRRSSKKKRRSSKKKKQQRPRHRRTSLSFDDCARRAERLIAAGDVAQGLEWVRRASALVEAEPSPRNAARVQVLAGRAAQELGQTRDAVAAFEAALETDPSCGEADIQLASIATQSVNKAGAWRHAMAALEKDPDNITYQIDLAVTLHRANQLDQADKAFEMVLRREPQHPRAISGMASIAVRRGEFERAREIAGPLIYAGKAPRPAITAYATACRSLGHTDEAIALLQRALSDPGCTSKMARRSLWNTLGHCLSSAKRYAEAFEAHRNSNHLMSVAYDCDAHDRYVDQLCRAFTKSAFDTVAPPHPERRVVLVVGMPRSGTSLVEQILGSHSAVHPCGEREDLGVLAKSLDEAKPDGGPAEVAVNLAESAMTQLRDYYVTRLGSQAPEGTTVVTDKMPTNYLYLGLAARLFSDVRIVHCARSPLDVCLSNFFQFFGLGLAWSTRLEWLGRRYIAYRRLMDHWEDVLPVPVHTVHYEKLVSDPETHVRALLEACDLPWEPACLHPEQNERRVDTASYAQVRRPIYRSSVSRWRRYEAELEPLRKMLEDAGIDVD